MKKLLLAFDADHFSEGAFNFAQQLNKLQPVLLTGVFLPLYDHVNLWNYADGLSGYDFLPMLDEKNVESGHKNIQLFESLCQKNGITFTIHKDFFDFALPELQKETRFSDLMLISSEKFHPNAKTDDASAYLQDILKATECPVIVVPETFTFPERNVLLFVETASSIYAIKQFAYLFPELCTNETILVFTQTGKKEPLQGEPYIEELVSQHFTNLTVCRSEANPEACAKSWAGKDKGALVVCGPHGHSSFARLFKKSFLTNIIDTHQLPVFIAHM